jgi:uncharacterized protein YtpQ (UPF0354 family)
MGFLDFLTKKKHDGRAAIADEFEALLLAQFPAATMTQNGPMRFRVEIPGRQEINVNLENLFRSSESSSPEERTALVQRYFDTVSGAAQKNEEPLSRGQIVPAIKDQLFFDEMGDKAKLVREHLAADLWISYVIDLPTRMMSLMEPQLEQLEQLGLARADLRELAIENLRAILPGVSKHGDGSWFLITAGDYTASVLLLDKVWAQLESEVTGDLVAAVPTRDVLLVTGSGSAEGITAVRAKALELEQTGSYAVSQTLLRRRNGIWESFS